MHGGSFRVSVAADVQCKVPPLLLKQPLHNVVVAAADTGATGAGNQACFTKKKFVFKEF